MAVTRTILPRKGLIQSQHGLTSYEADQDQNWALLDANVAFMSDLPLTPFQQLGFNGLISGFVLSPSSTLVPGITAGVLFAQGVGYAPATAPTLAPAPASQTSYLFYNSEQRLLLPIERGGRARRRRLGRRQSPPTPQRLSQSSRRRRCLAR